MIGRPASGLRPKWLTQPSRGQGLCFPLEHFARFPVSPISPPLFKSTCRAGSHWTLRPPTERPPAAEQVRKCEPRFRQSGSRRHQSLAYCDAMMVRSPVPLAVPSVSSQLCSINAFAKRGERGGDGRVRQRPRAERWDRVGGPGGGRTMAAPMHWEPGGVQVGPV